MLVLFETPAGMALFKVLKEKRVRKSDDAYELFSSPDKASEMCAIPAVYTMLNSSPRCSLAPTQCEAGSIPPLSGHH